MTLFSNSTDKVGDSGVSLGARTANVWSPGRNRECLALTILLSQWDFRPWTTLKGALGNPTTTKLLQLNVSFRTHLGEGSSSLVLLLLTKCEAFKRQVSGLKTSTPFSALRRMLHTQEPLELGVRGILERGCAVPQLGVALEVAKVGPS